MAKDSAIEWTHHTFNPWWGCMKVSEGCHHCYAEAFSKRTGHAIWGPPATTQRRLFGDKHWGEPLKWNREAEALGERRRVFCASMADVFEDHPDVVEARRDLFALIHDTPMLDWLLLSKRQENVREMVPWGDDWPLNVWLGTSVEHQAAANERVPRLLKSGARVKFLSCEPLLGPVDLEPWLPIHRAVDGFRNAGTYRRDRQVDWVICGGESGPKHRPMDLRWVRSLRDQCRATGVAFLFKQSSGLYPGRGRLLDGRAWDEYPVSPAVSREPAGATP